MRIASLFLLAIIPATLVAQTLPTKSEIEQLQAQYQSERKKVVDAGVAKRFLPELLDNADKIAERGKKALAEGRFLQASEAFRQARWQLPYQSPQVPKEHVARVLGSLRLRHGSEINCLAFSPDGKRLVTGSRDRTVKLWDMANGHELVTFTGHGETIRAVAFSPDGKMIASAGAEKDIKLWDPENGKEIRVIKGQGAYVTSLAYSPDGKYIASGQVSAGGDSQMVVINEVASGDMKRTISDFRNIVQSVIFASDGSILGVGVGDGQVRLYQFPKIVTEPNTPEYWTLQDLNGATYQLVISPDRQTLARCGADGVKLYQLVVPGSPFQVSAPRRVIPPPAPLVRFLNATYSKDGKTLFVACSDGIVRLFDPDSGTSVGTFKGHNGAVNTLAFNPAGNLLASGSADYTVRFWDFDIVLNARDITGHQGPVWKTAFSPDGQRIVSASADRTARIWDFTGGLLHTLKGHTSPLTAAVWTPDGKQVITASGDKLIKIWEAADGKELATLTGHQGAVTALDISKDGKRLLSGGADKLAILWDLETRKEARKFDTGSVVAAVGIGPNGQLATGCVDQTIKLWDPSTGTITASWAAHANAVSCVAFSPNGQYLASGGADQLVRVWPLATPGGNPITLSGHSGPVSSVAFRGDNQHVASTGSDLIVKLWKLEGNLGKEMQNYRGHRDWVTSAAFSKDGFYLISSGVDRTIKTWEITSREIPILSEHTGAVRAIAVSPDGKLIASGATDKLIKIWDRATGHELKSLSGHGDAVSSLLFLPDNRTLVSTANDQTIRLWDAVEGKEIPRTATQQQGWTGFLQPILHMATSPDGKKLFAWEPGNERFIKINAYDMSGRELFTFNDQGRNVIAVAFSGDGKVVTTASKEGGVRLFDLEKNGQQFPGGDWFIFNKEGGAGDLALTPDAKILVAGNEEGVVKILQVDGRKDLHTLKAHEGFVAVVQMAPDGKRFATVGQDNLVKLWDIATGQEVRRWDLNLPGQLRGSFIRTLAFTPDGKQLLTANANTTLFLLDLP